MTRSVHFDEEIHENASEYDPKRYMKQRNFIKNGKVVTNHSIPWGGGVSMCEGRSVNFIDLRVAEGFVDQVPLSRHFANKELKAFMVFLLMRYTLEIDPKSTERPTFKRWNGWVLVSCIPEVTSGSSSTPASDTMTICYIFLRVYNRRITDTVACAIFTRVRMRVRIQSGPSLPIPLQPS
jgi:hypothetical protein